MAFISVCLIEGMIKPSDCRFEASPKPQLIQSFYQQPEILPNLLNCVEEEFDPEKDRDYWKARIITNMIAAPHIVSISFRPSNPSEMQVLFLQKMTLEKITGFVVPEVSDHVCSVVHQISEEDEVESFPEELKPLLRDFLLDTTTLSLAITCYDELYQSVKTQGWIKV